jgi:hypothetical protein
VLFSFFLGHGTVVPSDIATGIIATHICGHTTPYWSSCAEQVIKMVRYGNNFFPYLMYNVTIE